MSRKRDIEGQLSLFDCEEYKVIKEKLENPSESPDDNLSRTQSLNPGQFAECNECWCYTCEHSTVGGSVVREFVDGEHACPSCEFCVTEGQADICVIGSSKEGCGFRAKKEGLI